MKTKDGFTVMKNVNRWHHNAILRNGQSAPSIRITQLPAYKSIGDWSIFNTLSQHLKGTIFDDKSLLNISKILNLDNVTLNGCASLNGIILLI